MDAGWRRRPSDAETLLDSGPSGKSNAAMPGQFHGEKIMTEQIKVNSMRRAMVAGAAAPDRLTEILLEVA